MVAQPVTYVAVYSRPQPYIIQIIMSVFVRPIRSFAVSQDNKIRSLGVQKLRGWLPLPNPASFNTADWHFAALL